MAAYYNEIDTYAAQWLRNLIKAGHIADGEVDTRSIVDVSPDELRGFKQCHFFAGIGGWSHALRLAGWSDDRLIWTGSCPCQPFSSAGKGLGTDDPRHLWPHFHRLITAVRPPVVMGEQVAGQAGYGWLDGMRADLAREGYASRGVDIPACSMDAPHIRQRLYWVACDMDHTNNEGLEGYAGDGNGGERWSQENGSIASSSSRHMADAGCEQRSARGESRSIAEVWGNRSQKNIHDQRCSDGNMENTNCQHGECRQVSQSVRVRTEKVGEGSDDHTGGRRASFWSDHIWLTGADGKSRRSKPSLSLLAHGISNRVGRLRAYGNAIVPPLAAQVIKAFMETDGGNT